MADKDIRVKGKAGLFLKIGKAIQNRVKKNERKAARTPRKVETTKTGGSAFDNPANLKSSTKQPGSSSSRTPTETAAVKARRIKAKKDALAEKRSLANVKKVAEEKATAAPVTIAELDQQAVHHADQKLADLIRVGALQAKGADYVLELKLASGRLLVNGHPFHSGMLSF